MQNKTCKRHRCADKQQPQQQQQQQHQRTQTQETIVRGRCKQEKHPTQTKQKAASKRRSSSRANRHTILQTSKQSNATDAHNDLIKQNKDLITWLVIPHPWGNCMGGRPEPHGNDCKRTYEVMTNQRCKCTCRMAGQRRIEHRLCATDGA